MQGTPVAVVNLGCRVNRVESDRIVEGLAARGCSVVDEASAELIVINTCAVTGEAEAKTRKAVRHALSQPLRPRVLVTGCVVNLHADELTAIDDRVVAEPAKARVVMTACRMLGMAEGAAELEAEAAGVSAGDGTSSAAVVGGMARATHEEALARLLGRSRLGIKVQDGCNHRCSYCIVWKARGPEVSAPVPQVLDEARHACASGIPEVVLTGVNLGRYRSRDDAGNVIDVGGLIERLLSETEVEQVRLSSIEPMDVGDSLLNAMAAHPRRVAPFLHLPLQSGSSATLRRMRRPYSGEEFLELVGRIRAAVPRIALSCDIIAGFPGETDAEFEESYRVCEQAGFARMHVFRYSARPGTPAATMSGQVEPAVMAKRAARLRELAARLAREDARGRVGTVERAVIEYEHEGAPGSTDAPTYEGTLSSFHKAVLKAPSRLERGSIIDVAIMDLDDEGRLHAKPVEWGR